MAIEVGKIEAALGLKELGPGVQWHLQSTCAVTGEGLDEGMDVLHDMIVFNKKSLKSSNGLGGGHKKFSHAGTPTSNHYNNHTSAVNNKDNSGSKQRRKVQRSKSLYH